MALSHVCSDKNTGSGLLRLLYSSLLHTLLYRLWRACASVPYRLLRLSITGARQLRAGLLHCHYRCIAATRETEAEGRRENVTREKDLQEMECKRASESLSHTDAVALRGVRFARHGTISGLNSC